MGAFGSNSAIAMASGKLPGVFAGAILAALVGYALWLLARPLVRDRDLKRVLLLLTGLLVLKTLALRFFAGFSVDLGTFEAWALKIATEGPARAYQRGLLPRLSARIPVRALGSGCFCERGRSRRWRRAQGHH